MEPIKDIAYFHDSKYGNGAKVAEEFSRIMADRGVTVSVRHMKDADPKKLPPADLYVFSTPGRFGKPKRSARSFLGKVTLPPGTSYALLTTEGAPQPDKKTGRMPTEEEVARWQKVRPIINELLQGKGLTEVAEEAVYVTNLKGPLEEGWEKKVASFADRVLLVGTAG
jgi:menaquinone-dependent protoporphyrinogen IX oxidase